MQLNVFRTLWGVTTPWQQTVSELRSVGCCGIEARVPLTPEEQEAVDAQAWQEAAEVQRHWFQLRRQQLLDNKRAR